MIPASKRALGFAAIAVLAAEAASGAPRPMDPWILRVTMPKKVRMNIITLSEGLTVAYDAANSALYQAWTGSYVNGTANYNYAKGILSCSYDPMGRILYKQGPGGGVSETPATRNLGSGSTPANETPVTAWSATAGGSPAAVKPDYRGYTLNHATESATLRYRLTIGMAKVEVAETPEAAGGGLQRDFTFKNIPAGTVVSLLLSGNTVNKASGGSVVEEWVATGAGKVETRDGKRYLVHDKDGQTRLIGTWK